MSIPRLTFLYPSLFKATRLSEPAFSRAPAQTSVTARRTRYPPQKQTERYQTTSLERYGPAIELPPPSYDEARDAKEKPDDAADAKEETRKDAGSEPERLESKSERNDTAKAVYNSAGEEQPSEGKETELEGSERPMEKVLQMPAPSSSKKDKPPHLETPPYVHHFDTYTLVKDLGKGGFTQDQSITLMKSVRSLLAANLELAKDGLVSKSDTENVCGVQYQA